MKIKDMANESLQSFDFTEDYMVYIEPMMDDGFSFEQCGVPFDKDRWVNEGGFALVELLESHTHNILTCGCFEPDVEYEDALLELCKVYAIAQLREAFYGSTI